MPGEPKIMPNEKQLFARMARGDEAAFADIFFYYIPLIQPHIFKMTRSEADTQDIIHDTFLSLWSNRSKMLRVENHRAYIFKISTNKTYDWLQKKARERITQAHLKITSIDYTNTTEEAIEFHQSKEFIDQAVAELPSQRKLVYKLSREQGLSHEKIAQRLRISKNTVNNHLTEALRFIKEYLKKIPGATFILLAFLLKK